MNCILLSHALLVCYCHFIVKRAPQARADPSSWESRRYGLSRTPPEVEQGPAVNCRPSDVKWKPNLSEGETQP